jgi:hypothetical protein
MTIEHAKQFIPILQAFADGKTIEYQNSSGVWLSVTDPNFSYYPDRYRIKPEPLECWCYVSPTGTLNEGSMSIKKPVNSMYRKFREVIEPENQ